MKIIDRVLSHWKTTSAGLLIGVITAMLWLGKITAEQWMICIGGVTTAVGLMSKDWDKKDNAQ